MNSVYFIIVGFLLICIITFYAIIAWSFRTIGKELQEKLKTLEGDEKAQEELKLKFVRALHPPRFNRD